MISEIKKALWQSEDGQALVEYALVIVLLAVVAVASFEEVANRVIAMYQNILTAVSSVL